MMTLDMLHNHANLSRIGTCTSSRGSAPRGNASAHAIQKQPEIHSYKINQLINKIAHNNKNIKHFEVNWPIHVLLQSPISLSPLIQSLRSFYELFPSIPELRAQAKTQFAVVKF